MADICHDINPAFDDYQVSFEELAKYDDLDRGVWIAQERNGLQRFTERVAVNPKANVGAIDLYAKAKADGLRALGRKLEHRNNSPEIGLRDFLNLL